MIIYYYSVSLFKLQFAPKNFSLTVPSCWESRQSCRPSWSSPMILERSPSWSFPQWFLPQYSQFFSPWSVCLHHSPLFFLNSPQDRQSLVSWSAILPMTTWYNIGLPKPWSYWHKNIKIAHILFIKKQMWQTWAKKAQVRTLPIHSLLQNVRAWSWEQCKLSIFFNFSQDSWVKNSIYRVIFFNWTSPENVSRLPPPPHGSTGPPLLWQSSKYGGWEGGDSEYFNTFNT